MEQHSRNAAAVDCEVVDLLDLVPSSQSSNNSPAPHRQKRAHCRGGKKVRNNDDDEDNKGNGGGYGRGGGGGGGMGRGKKGAKWSI